MPPAPPLGCDSSACTQLDATPPHAAEETEVFDMQLDIGLLAFAAAEEAPAGSPRATHLDSNGLGGSATHLDSNGLGGSATHLDSNGLGGSSELRELGYSHTRGAAGDAEVCVDKYPVTID
jgi:hypothetical protein